ncbi:type VI secretion system Vgr family protein [Paraburkholderia dilworthii]|uniref:Type VI secretion system Vgr family protein n=1 Tax=Paraburkholderia dilworthii TaxID=948106 RepID=A0ABW9D6K3_9BURK
MVSEVLNKALRAGYTQLGRLIKLDTPLGDDWLVPMYVKGSGRLGGNFEFTVDAVSTYGEKIKLSALVLKPVTLWIQQTDGSYMPIHGYVQHARRLGSDGPLTSYQIQFSSWLSLLKLSSDCRDWQEIDGRQILSDVFAKTPQAQGQYRFDLRSPIRSYSQRVQWEDDWNFVHRSMEEVGVFPRFEFAKDGKSHTVVITDDLYFVPPLPQQVVTFSRSATNEEFDGLTQWSEQQDSQSESITTNTFDYMRPDLPKEVSSPAFNQDELPAQGEKFIYTGGYSWSDSDMGEQQARIRTEEMASRSKRYFGVGSLRCALPGYWYQLDGHPVHDSEQTQDREMAIIAVDWLIQNNVPGIEALAQFPRSLRAEVEQVRAAGAGSTVRHTDGSTGFFQVEIEAQRRRVPFRSPLKHHKPEMHLQTGIVGTPDNEEIFIDSLNRSKVWLSWSRKDRNERASAWIRAAMPDAGQQRGGHFALRKGDEVLVGFVNGDCDRPVIISRLHGGATKPVFHSHGLFSGHRSKEYGGDGFNEFLMDDASGQNRMSLSSTSYATGLQMGYLIQHTDNTRGAFIGTGFDLKSGAYGAIRAAQGMVISTQPVTAQPLGVAAATGQLAGAEAVLETVSKASETNRGESLQDGHDALKTFTDATQHSVAASVGKGGRTAGGGTGNANGFSKAALVLTSPDGIATTTQQSLHFTADEHVNAVARKNVILAAGKSLLASVMDGISLFAQNLGIKLIAGKGKIDIQALSDAMNLLAQLDVKVESATGRLVLTAKEEVWIGAGGSYISIKGGGIENVTTGHILERCSTWDKPGGASAAVSDPLQATPMATKGGRGMRFSG